MSETRTAEEYMAQMDRITRETTLRLIATGLMTPEAIQATGIEFTKAELTYARLHHAATMASHALNLLQEVGHLEGLDELMPGLAGVIEKVDKAVKDAPVDLAALSG